MLVFKSEYGDIAECGHCGRKGGDAGGALKKCAGCLRVAYCGAEHQKAHWRRRHRGECCPFKVVRGEDDSVGRFVVATRDLSPGEVIFTERPITVGPKQFTPPVCMGCYSPCFGDDDEDSHNKSSSSSSSSSFRSCSGCGWPACSERCEEAPVHRLECGYLEGCRFKPTPDPAHPDLELPIYECLSPLRCVLAKRFAPENWRVLTLMEQHAERRREEPLYRVNRTNTVDFILQQVPLDFEVAAEDIQAAVDVLDVNAFEIRSNNFRLEERQLKRLA